MFSTKAVASFGKRKKKSVHRTTVSGPARVLKAEWSAIAKDIRAASAAVHEMRASGITLTVQNGRFRRAKGDRSLREIGYRGPLLK